MEIEKNIKKLRLGTQYKVRRLNIGYSPFEMGKAKKKTAETAMKVRRSKLALDASIE